MFYLEDNTLYNSDWHLNNKNVWIYEFHKRKRYINEEKYPFIKTEVDLKSFYEENVKNNEHDLNQEFILDTEYNMLLDIYDSLKYYLENYKIHSYVNLGDFLFNPSGNKLSFYTTTKNYQLVLKIFDLLDDYLVDSTLYLGNHDDYDKAHELYDDLFTHICGHQFHTGTMIAHYPYDKDNKFFVKNELVGEGFNVKKSIHGHKHSSTAQESRYKHNKGIEYINVSIENFM